MGRRRGREFTGRRPDGRAETAGHAMTAERRGADAPSPGPVRARRGPGVRTRILGWYVPVLIVTLVLSVVLGRSVLLRRFDSRVDRALNERAEQFRDLASADGSSPGDLRGVFDDYLAQTPLAPDDATLTFVDSRFYRGSARPRHLLADIPELRAEWVGLRRSERGELDTPAGPVRWLAVPVQQADGSRGTFVAASFVASARGDVQDAAEVAAVVSISTLIVASALAWVVAGRVLSPVRRVTETARSISDTDLAQRIEVASDDEIGELARTFNSMLDRLEAAFTREREFVRDASHELRTPITVIRGHLELMGDDPDERRETIALVTDELDRMSRLVEDLLLLARAERRDFLRIEPVGVDLLVEEIHAKAQGLGPRHWNLQVNGRATVAGDRQRLTQAMMNLVGNAANHTTAEDTIEIGVAVEDDAARLWVRDTGPGIEPKDHDRIFQRFARARNGKRPTQGAGLGLAIARTIAEAHGGSIELDSAPGRGSTFTIVLPVDREVA